MRSILATLLLAIPAAAFADPTPAVDVRTMASDDCAKARKAGKTCVIDFGAEILVGEVGSGEGERIDTLQIGRAASLIRLRRDFITEILRSAEDLD